MSSTLVKFNVLAWSLALCEGLVWDKNVDNPLSDITLWNNPSADLEVVRRSTEIDPALAPRIVISLILDCLRKWQFFYTHFSSAIWFFIPTMSGIFSAPRQRNCLILFLILSPSFPSNFSHTEETHNKNIDVQNRIAVANYWFRIIIRYLFI